MNNIKKISIVSLFILLCLPSFSFAQGTKTQLETPKGPGVDSALVPCGGPGQDQECTAEHGLTLIKSVMNLVFMLAGFIVAIMFMYAGFLLITSVGDTAKIQKAKNIFKRVVIGFIIMYLSYILIKNLLVNIKAEDFFIKLIK